MDFSSLPPYRGLEDRTPDRDDRATRGGSLELGLLAIVLFVAVSTALLAAGLLLAGATGPPG